MQHIRKTIYPALYHSGLIGGKRRFDPVPLIRSRAVEPEDKGLFVKPIKQSFIKNRRIMDSTARLIALITGWAGQGAPIQTTQGILAKHIGKSVRQVQRMLNDAWREGYLTYNYTKSRATGMITGIQIFMRFERILKAPNYTKSRTNPATTKTSDTNRNHIKYIKDEALEDRLKRFAKVAGMDYSPG